MSRTPSGADSNAGIDLEQNSKDLKIGKDIYVRILSKAMDQTKQDIQELEAALPVENFDLIQAISHRWKGDYDNMRIVTLSSVAKEMNEIVRSSQDKERIVVLLDDFRSAFAKLQEVIARS